MKFAFLVHPLNYEFSQLWSLLNKGEISRYWGSDPMGMAEALNVDQSLYTGKNKHTNTIQLVDELKGLVSATKEVTEGRVYEIPFEPADILAHPGDAVASMVEATNMATDWGAELIGLGSLTAVVGGRGQMLADESGVPVTTGNSLTTFTALQNLLRIVEEIDEDLSRATVCVVGIPGSIASALACMIQPLCKELILVCRRKSRPAMELSRELDTELTTDLEDAVSRSNFVLTATSSGGCIPQKALRPGSVVIDVGIPTDVQGSRPEREDVLFLTGGLINIPPKMNRDSIMLWFQQGAIPSCLAETMILGLEGRRESFSIGRELPIEKIEEIGECAARHGFSCDNFYSFGTALESEDLLQFLKLRRRLATTVPQVPLPLSKKTIRNTARLYERYINPTYLRLADSEQILKTIVQGEGCFLRDHQGRNYLDFVSGFGSVNFGHNHPAIAAAVSEAMTSMAPGFSQTTLNPYTAAAASELAEMAPKGLGSVFFCNSGTESVEAAMKLSRATTGRKRILSCSNSYHGKSMGALSLTNKPNYQRPFEPLIPEVDDVPFGDLEMLEAKLKSQKFAAFFVEPIQGEGGICVPPEGYLEKGYELCQKYGTLFVADEVQTGMGRTGVPFAVELSNVTPDIICLAKSLGGGMLPIGAIVTRRDLWMKAYGTAETFALHTSTFGGGSLASAAAVASLTMLQKSEFLDNVQKRGSQLKDRLQKMTERYSCIAEVRGTGLMLGVEFIDLVPPLKKHWKLVAEGLKLPFLVSGYDEMIKPLHAMHAMQILQQKYDIITTLTRSNPLVMRIQPPLIISESETELFLQAFEATCMEVDLWIRMMSQAVTKAANGKLDTSVELKESPSTQFDESLVEGLMRND